MNRDLSGIFPPITTPFDSDGELLLDRFKENLRRWSEFKLSGIVVLGSNGESAFLSEEERLRLVRESRPLISAAGIHGPIAASLLRRERRSRRWIPGRRCRRV